MEVTVDWKEVPCIDRNSNITMFAIRFVIIEAGGGQSGGGISLVEGSAEVGGESTLGDLFGATNYSISVAAQNTRGEMGPYSAPIIVETLPCGNDKQSWNTMQFNRNPLLITFLYSLPCGAEQRGSHRSFDSVNICGHFAGLCGRGHHCCCRVLEVEERGVGPTR